MVIAKIPVSGGTLEVWKNPDPDYPGVDIEFTPDNEGYKGTFPRVVIEQDYETGKLRALIWNNPESEDYSHSHLLWDGGEKNK